MSVFHECYGTVAQSTLRLIKSKNISSSDWDMILEFLGLDFNDERVVTYAGEVNEFIKDRSLNGYFQMPPY